MACSSCEGFSMGSTSNTCVASIRFSPLAPECKGISNTCTSSLCRKAVKLPYKEIRDYIDLSDSILCFVMLLNVLSYRQDKRMDELNLFIEHYSKYIVSMI